MADQSSQVIDCMVTLCPSIYQSDDVKQRPLSTILTAFQRDERVQQQVEQVRAAQDKESYAQAKNKLPVVIFGGKFNNRKNSGLVEASGLMALDFDVDTQAESDELKDMLKDDPYIYSFFLSTGGLGYRALIKIPKVESDAQYKSYFYSISEHYKNIDAACKDIARASFYTHDPDLYINPEAKVWTDYKELDSKPNLSQLTKPIAKKTDYKLANRIINVIRYAQEGERHSKILKAARLMGGYISAGRIEYHEAERLLKQEAAALCPNSIKKDERTINDGLEDGMQEPIRDEEELQIEEKYNQLGKIYYTAIDAEDKIFEKYRNGIGEAWSTGYPSVDQLYKVFPGYFTTIYGSSFSGKSLLWLDFLKNMSYRHGLKHCIFSPETGAYDDVFIKLCEMVAEKDFYDTYNNRMSEEELRRAKEFVDKHFIVVDPGEHSLDLETALEYLQIIERYYSVKVNTLTLDPWNDLDHPIDEADGREDKYLEKAIKKVRLSAYLNDWHICIITHARDQQMVHDKNDGVRYYPPATFREVAGGQTWSRKGFQMASVWRPPKGLTEIDGTILQGDGSETLWFQQKYKPDYAGEKGVAKLKLDLKRHRFYEGDDHKPRYATLIPEKEHEQEQKTETNEPPF
jgi:hypothetical protein